MTYAERETSGVSAVAMGSRRSNDQGSIEVKCRLRADMFDLASPFQAQVVKTKTVDIRIDQIDESLPDAYPASGVYVEFEY